MSWLFSQALVEAYSPDTFSDGEPCAQLNVMPTPHKFWRKDKMMDASDLSRFGLTCAVLTGDRGEAVLMSFLEASPVRTSAHQDEVQASRVNDLASGQKWRESSVRFDLDSCSWKIHPCSSNEVLPWSSVILPKWGMAANGFVYRRLKLERPIKGIASGSWPTPRATDYKGARCPLAAAKVRARGFYPNLQEAIAEAAGGGTLNPDWDEWLMGWPIGWTELKPLEMGKFREWQQQHSLC